MDEANLFVEKAEKLERLSFYKKVSQGSGVRLSAGVNKAALSSRFGPDEESIDSFVLTFRFFIQDNEKISLRNMASIFESNLSSEKTRSIYQEAREKLNEYLDSNTSFNFGGVLTNREIMDVFIYGGLSHATDSKKLKYDEWKSSTILFPFLENEFVKILNQVFYVIRVLKLEVKEVLQKNA
jgi:hypothetical protein